MPDTSVLRSALPRNSWNPSHEGPHRRGSEAIPTGTHPEVPGQSRGDREGSSGDPAPIRSQGRQTPATEASPSRAPRRIVRPRVIRCAHGTADQEDDPYHVEGKEPHAQRNASPGRPHAPIIPQNFTITPPPTRSAWNAP